MIAALLDNYYVKILAVDMGIQWVAWAFAAFFQTERFYDLTGKNSVLRLEF